MKDYSNRSLTYSLSEDSWMMYQFNRSEVSPLFDEMILILC